MLKAGHDHVAYAEGTNAVTGSYSGARAICPRAFQTPLLAGAWSNPRAFFFSHHIHRRNVIRAIDTTVISPAETNDRQVPIDFSKRDGGRLPAPT
jgi:hypothetical protein